MCESQSEVNMLWSLINLVSPERAFRLDNRRGEKGKV